MIITTLLHLNIFISIILLIYLLKLKGVMVLRLLIVGMVNGEVLTKFCLVNLLLHISRVVA